VIDPDGVVQEVLREVKPKEHDDRVLAALGTAGPGRYRRDGHVGAHRCARAARPARRRVSPLNGLSER
jgi:hypothetical protein